MHVQGPPTGRGHVWEPKTPTPLVTWVELTTGVEAAPVAVALKDCEPHRLAQFVLAEPLGAAGSQALAPLLERRVGAAHVCARHSVAQRPLLVRSWPRPFTR